MVIMIKIFIKKNIITLTLAILLLVLSVVSLFIGVIDINIKNLFLDSQSMEVFVISRLPRLLAILCTGVGMSVAGLIMQQLCMNKFVSPTTGATISSAQFGILLCAGCHDMGQGDICIYQRNTWYMDFCLVYTANTV